MRKADHSELILFSSSPPQNALATLTNGKKSNPKNRVKRRHNFKLQASSLRCGYFRFSAKKREFHLGLSPPLRAPLFVQATKSAASGTDTEKKAWKLDPDIPKTHSLVGHPLAIGEHCCTRPSRHSGALVSVRLLCWPRCRHPWQALTMSETTSATTVQGIGEKKGLTFALIPLEL